MNDEIRKDLRERTIRITDLQSTFEGDNAVEIMTKGTVEGQPDDYTISYREDFGDGMTSLTRIKVRDRRRVSIIRDGSITSELIVEKGKRHNCQYSTPYGDLMMGIYGLSLRSDIGSEGGELSMDYTVDFNGELTAQKKMRITVSD